MNLTISSEKKEDFLQITCTGSIATMEDLRAHSKLIYEEIKKYDFQKILINEPEIILPLDIVPYFELVKDYVQSYPADIHHIKVAVVVSHPFKEVISTWETLCQSRGLFFFGFTSLQEAIDCLLDENDE